MTLAQISLLDGLLGLANAGKIKGYWQQIILNWLLQQYTRHMTE
jgi:hypothetical protein